ncbi:MAG: phosphoglycerate dehydrogenase [Candidatus Marinimicrobia bacterium]|nr:phosphoglycerate dehydrogenase [Candidatus Neomarinimicrobiota bacterium]MCF7828939.1 phosphoglycerate dehydrogenase [Candidatus Neomarinimicrobiota bacterium]MCF7879899.1 phosphoglycerate dehydrogenase [Candidatus Neomarinimicrobiota bacterium]
MYKVLISDAIDEQGIDLLNETGEIEVIYKPQSTVEDYLDVVGEIHGWIIRSGTKVGKELLNQADNLRVIGRAGVGVDNVDLETATLRGVIVMNTPTGNTNAATEQTMALMLAAARKISPAHQALREGRWDRQKYIGRELREKTLGIIGLGRIGQGVAKRAASFEMDLLGYDPFLSEEQFDALDIKKVELEEIFTQADIVTAHVPLSEQTRNLIDTEEIAKMKDGVILVNAARGGVYNEDAVAEGLRSGKIGAIGFDVFASEPLEKDHPFLEFDNAVLTPHLGASTREAKENVALDVCKQVRDFLLSEKVKNAVNIPFADFSKIKQMEPYIDLADRLGLLQIVRADGAPKEVEIRASGDFSDLKPITLAALKGLLGPISGDKVNLMNAALLAKQRNIKIQESYEYDDSGYTNLIEVVVTTENGTKKVSGSLFGKMHPRIVRIDEFHMDARPVGTVLMIRNNDVPGVIGNVGSFLGSRNINIAEYRLGRQEQGNTALAMVNLDGPLSEEDLASLEEEPNILDVQQVTFPKE